MEQQNLHRGAYHGSIGGYYPIFLKNIILTIFTLGIYSAWATNNNRKYFLSNSEFAGGRYDYHGTGLEIFIGRLKAFGIIVATFIIFGGLTFAVNFISETLTLLPIISLYAFIFFFLFPIAIVGTLKYRLSRTSWNNIRHNFAGNWRELAPIYIKGILLSIVTLGFYIPFFTVQVYKFIFKNAWLGDKQYDFDGSEQEFFIISIKGFFFGILTLGIYLFWYYADYLNFIYNHLMIDGKRYQFNVTGIDVLALILPNILIVIFTLGFGIPIAVTRAIEFLMDNLMLDGEFDPQSVKQGRVDMASATGEGLDTLLEVDI